jgi:hypothetical protein
VVFGSGAFEGHYHTALAPYIWIALTWGLRAKFPANVSGLTPIGSHLNHF